MHFVSLFGPRDLRKTATKMSSVFFFLALRAYPNTSAFAESVAGTVGQLADGQLWITVLNRS